MGYEVAYYPDPVNQFNRLYRTSGSKGVGTYAAGAPWDNYHYDPAAHRSTDYDNRNCTAAVSACLRDAHTSGKSKTTPNAIRNNQHDFDGGIGWDDANDSWWQLFGDRLTIPPAADWYDVISGVRMGRAWGVSGDYDQVPEQYQSQKGGTFDHAFGIFDYRPSDGKILVLDPLARKLAWWPQFALRGAAEKIALAQRGTKSRLFVASTRIIEGTTVVYHGWRVFIHPVANQSKRRYWQYILDSNERYIVNRIPRETGGFSAECTKPVDRTVGKAGDGKHGLETGDRHRLVKIQGGSYDKRWVAAGYADEV